MTKEKKKNIRKQTEKKERILEVALEMFSKYGFLHTTINDIGARAGVSDGTIYLYFKDKDELMISVMNKSLETMLTEIDEIIKHEDNPLAKFYAFFEAFVDVFARRPDIARLIVIEQFHVSKLSINNTSYKAFEQATLYLKNICDKAIEKGYLREVKSDILALYCHGLVDTLLKIWVVSDYQADMKYLKNKFLDLLMFGLVP